MIRIHQSTRNPDYIQIAEAILSAFAETFREQGEFSADYGLSVNLLKSDPVEITMEGKSEDPGYHNMVAAIARLPQPNLDIKTIPSSNTSNVVRVHICLDTVCLPPVESPMELASAVAGLTKQQKDPFQDIFQVFPGN